MPTIIKRTTDKTVVAAINSINVKEEQEAVGEEAFILGARDL
jgi:hypothetical protein